MQKLIISCLLCVFCSGVFAEFRVWQDRDGNEIEAEYMREMFDKVTLKKRDGTEIRMEVEEFSDLDQKYFRVMVPPRISVDVKRVSNVKPKPPDPLPDTSFITTVTKETVTLKKESSRPFTSRLNLEMFMIAEEVDVGRNNFVLMDYSKVDFMLKDTKKDAYIFKSKSIETETYNQKGTSQPRGEKYIGYILVITDMQGNLVLFDTSINGDWVENPDLIPNLRDLWLRGLASKRSRHFDKTGKKVKVPRVAHFRAS